MRQELSILDSKNYTEKKEIERFDLDHRDAINISHKNYQEIARLKDIIGARDLDNRGFQAKGSTLESEIE